MNFTREPIIETVITPREGCKLVIRSSKGASQEEYFVDAVEVVSFGHSFFYRSLERPKSFLVPISDYELLELKETRMVLKSASNERSIKIGGGRDNNPPRPREEKEGEASSSEGMRSSDKKRSRRRSRRSRDREEEGSFGEEKEEERGVERETSLLPDPEEKAPSFVSKLFPPPSTLIRDTVSRYKVAEAAPLDEEGASQLFEETPKIDEMDIPLAPEEEDLLEGKKHSEE